MSASGTGTPKPHGPLARTILAAGGIAALVALAEAMYLIAGTIGGARGRYAAALVAVLVLGACQTAHGLRRYRPTPLTRPAPVRLPDRDEHLEPAA